MCGFNAVGSVFISTHLPASVLFTALSICIVTCFNCSLNSVKLTGCQGEMCKRESERRKGNPTKKLIQETIYGGEDAVVHL